MDGSYQNHGYEDLVDDRVSEGVFRIDRSVYTDQNIFDAEIERIFEKSWVYLCHESQIPEEGSYFAADIGRHPVVGIGQNKKGIYCFFNVC